MKKIRFFDIKNILKQNSKINVIACAITPWHALGVISSVKKIASVHKDVKVLIIIMKHNDTGYAIDERSFEYISNDVFDIYYLDDDNVSVAKKMLKNIILPCKNIITANKINTQLENDFHIVYPYKINLDFLGMVYSTRKNHNIKFVISDEGIGTYMKSEEEWDREVLNAGNNKLKYIMKKINLSYSNMFNKKCIEIIKRKGLLFDWNILVKNQDKKLVNNECILPFYKQMFSESKKVENSIYNGAIVINTQCYYDSGWIDNDFDIDLLKIVCIIARKNKVPVVLKTHPREKNVQRYKELPCTLDVRNGISQEEIFASTEIKPLCVIGLTTTTLVTLKLFFDVEAISLAKIGLSKSNNNSLNNHMHNFINTFNNQVLIPNDEELLGHMLETIINNR